MIVGIAAVARNGVIGDGQDIPWRIPQDWRRFRELTSGHVLIMGRKTYDSIGRPLPGRTTFVVTRDKTWRRDAVRAVPCLDEALALAGDLAPARSSSPAAARSIARRGTASRPWRSLKSIWSRLGRSRSRPSSRTSGGDRARGPRRFQLRELPAGHSALSGSLVSRGWPAQ